MKEKLIIRLTEVDLHNIVKNTIFKMLNRVPLAKAIYNKVINNLENYCQFTVYDEFKDYANSLPKINEDIEYLDNHPNKDVALAMEIIIQIGNAWEDGIRELTPSMKKYLIASLTILNRTDRNKQINALIKNGNYYLTHMEVLECHNYVDYNIMPAL